MLNVEGWRPNRRGAGYLLNHRTVWRRRNGPLAAENITIQISLVSRPGLHVNSQRERGREWANADLKRLTRRISAKRRMVRDTGGQDMGEAQRGGRPDLVDRTQGADADGQGNGRKLRCEKRGGVGEGGSEKDGKQ